MIFNMTGPGSSGGKLTVTTPGAGITVAAARDGKTKTKVSDSEGLAVFMGLESGDWVLTITDGSQTSVPVPITIKTDYAAVLTFFAATIHVTYPAGSVCTATDGAITLTAPDTGGTWDCTVPNAGTWTVTVVDKGWTKTVNMTNSGQSVNVNLTCVYLYNYGDQCTDVTGGWESRTMFGVFNVNKNTDNIYIEAVETAAGGGGVIFTNNKIALTGNELILTFSSSRINKTDTILFVSDNASTDSIVAQIALGKTGDNVTAVLDISGLSGEYQVGVRSYTSGGNTNVTVHRLIMK